MGFTPDPVDCTRLLFGFMWISFMLIWILLSHKYIQLFQKNHCSDISNMIMVASFVDI